MLKTGKKILYFKMIVVIFICLQSCNIIEHNHLENKQKVVSHKETFPFPAIPSILATTNDRADFLLLHYWDNFNFNDTISQRQECMEQGIVDYLNMLLHQNNNDIIESSLNNFCSHFIKNRATLEKVPIIIEKYLYENNSPLYNESLFSIFLRIFLQYQDTQISDMYSRWDYLFKLINKNNPGQKAADFIYYTIDKKKKSLYNTKCNIMMILFYDPNCENCHKTIHKIKNCSELLKNISNNNITLLSIDIEDNEEEWHNMVFQLPNNCIKGIDKRYIQNNNLYDLKSVPSIYLLDNNKKVLLKDVSFEDVCFYLGIN